MFGVGLPEMVVIFVVAVVIFGPDRLPDFARQAARMLRQLREFSRSTRDDIRAELGPGFADFELTDLHPRRAMQKYLQDAWDETDEDQLTRPGHRPLGRGERPPYDPDAT